ncbi:putative MFS-type transporter YhjX [Paraliobacillus sp. PM-2]|uniref:MFS transporter n=1 Tax=Paraliobacillus sp. PM-2 TaxID=1462524 RepID=UPI00061B8C89|nr:MFS transporter [Paraliobacillus sp. PM-2]CQR45904.1 putative MFS-type transporter YhjX [Paraliobacillus sp. PM-2]
MAKNKKIFYGWWIVVACFISMTTLFTPIVNLISLFTDPVSQDLGISRSQFNLYFTIVTFSAMIASPFAGRLMKKFDIRVYLTFFTILAAISYIGFSFSTNIIMFYFFSILQGIALIAGSIIPASVLITNWFNEKRGLSLGIALSGSGFGGIILSPVINTLITQLGWRTTYLIIAGIILITILPFTIFVVRFRPADLGLAPLGETTVKDPKEAKELKGLMQGQAIKTPSFWLLALAIIITGIVANTMIINLTPYLTDIGATTQRAAFLLAFGSATVLIGKLVVGRLFDKVNLVTALIILSVCNILSFVSLLGADKLIPGLLYATFTGVGATALTIAPSYVTAKIFGEKDFSSIFGVVSIFSSLGTALAAVVSGVLYSINNSYILVLYTLMVLAAVSFILYALAVKTKPKY